jgi:hypothetical protein
MMFSRRAKCCMWNIAAKESDITAWIMRQRGEGQGMSRGNAFGQRSEGDD